MKKSSNRLKSEKPEPVELKLPVAPGFDSPPPRLSVADALTFCEEMRASYQYSPLDRQMREDRPSEEFILR